MGGSNTVIRIHGVRSTMDASGSIIATVEAFHAGAPVPGCFGDVILSEVEYTDICAQKTAETIQSRWIEAIGKADARFAGATIANLVRANAVASQGAKSVAATVTFPFDLAIEV